jgi:lipopolysaccharide export system protein LptA
VNPTISWRGWVGILCLLLALGVWSSPVTGWAQAKKGVQKDLPLHIIAARLEADQKERVITFSGQVKATYGDNILYAEQLRVYYEPPKSGPKPAAAAPSQAPPQEKGASPLGELGGEKINRIVASGGVRFVQGDKVATGKEATYYRDREELVLVGDPQVWSAENTLKGERIVFNLQTNRVMVESSPRKRVEAHLYPSGKGLPEAAKGLPLGTQGRKER